MSLPTPLTREPESGTPFGSRAGKDCNRPQPIYSPYRLTGFRFCPGRMVHRNKQIRCPRCGAVA